MDEESPTVDPLPEISSISERLISMLSISSPSLSMFSWIFSKIGPDTSLGTTDVGGELGKRIMRRASVRR